MRAGEVISVAGFVQGVCLSLRWVKYQSFFSENTFFPLYVRKQDLSYPLIQVPWAGGHLSKLFGGHSFINLSYVLFLCCIKLFVFVPYFLATKERQK